MESKEVNSWINNFEKESRLWKYRDYFKEKIDTVVNIVNFNVLKLTIYFGFLDKLNNNILYNLTEQQSINVINEYISEYLTFENREILFWNIKANSLSEYLSKLWISIEEIINIHWWGYTYLSEYEITKWRKIMNINNSSTKISGKELIEILNKIKDESGKEELYKRLKNNINKDDININMVLKYPFLSSIYNWKDLKFSELKKILRSPDFIDTDKINLINSYEWIIDINFIFKEIRINGVLLALIKKIDYKTTKIEDIESLILKTRLHIEIFEEVFKTWDKILINTILNFLLYYVNLRHGEAEILLKKVYKFGFYRDQEKIDNLLTMNYGMIMALLFNNYNTSDWETSRTSNFSILFKRIVKSIRNEYWLYLYDYMIWEVEKVYEDITKWKDKYSETDRKINWWRIQNFQNKRISSTDKKIAEKIWIKEEWLDLSIYVRYKHTVDYPEIAEYIIIFLQKYLNDWYSKYFSKIRIIPRMKDIFPDSWVDLWLWNIDKYNVDKKEFKIALNYHSIPLYLSHSSNIRPYWTPNIVSAWMWRKQQIKTMNDVKSKIELELHYQTDSEMSFLGDSNLDTLLNEVVKNIKEVEQKLDKINRIRL